MIYFAQDCDKLYIKIGCSENPGDRVSQLQTANPSKIVLLMAMEGDKTTEKELHQRFAHAREVGEWFRPAPELLHGIICLAAKARPVGGVSFAADNCRRRASKNTHPPLKGNLNLSELHDPMRGYVGLWFFTIRAGGKEIEYQGEVRKRLGKGRYAVQRHSWLTGYASGGLAVVSVEEIASWHLFETAEDMCDGIDDYRMKHRHLYPER